MNTPTAAWPTNSLTTSLARAGWGDLSGRSMQGIRSTLRALVDLLPYKSGEGFATAAQIADAAGLSERWVRRCLHLLEDAELVRWTRGGVVMGKPAPSHFRVSKRMIVALIGGARPMLAAVQRARAARTAARLDGLRWIRGRGRETRRSAHAELSASPHPLRGGAKPPSPEKTPLYLDDETAQIATAGAMKVRQALRQAKTARRKA